MADIREQVKEECAELERQIDTMSEQLAARTAQIRKLRREHRRLAGGHAGGGDGGSGGGGMQGTMAELREAQEELAREQDALGDVDSELDRLKIDILETRQTLEELDEDIRENERAVQVGVCLHLRCGGMWGGGAPRPGPTFRRRRVGRGSHRGRGRAGWGGSLPGGDGEAGRGGAHDHGEVRAARAWPDVGRMWRVVVRRGGGGGGGACVRQLMAGVMRQGGHARGPGAAAGERGAFDLCCGPLWLRFAYVTPVLVTKLRMRTPGQAHVDSEVRLARRGGGAEAPQLCALSTCRALSVSAAAAASVCVRLRRAGRCVCCAINTSEVAPKISEVARAPSCGC
jgi:prefoldin subunit 5